MGYGRSLSGVREEHFAGCRAVVARPYSTGFAAQSEVMSGHRRAAEAVSSPAIVAGSDRAPDSDGWVSAGLSCSRSR